MAQTSKGQKWNRIPGYTRTVKGIKQKVKPHARSTQKTSRGVAKSK